MKYKNIQPLQTYEEIMIIRAHKKWNKLSNVEKAFEKCDESIKCMNQNGGSKILTIINFEYYF